MKPSSFFSKSTLLFLCLLGAFQPIKAQNSLLFEVQHPKQKHSSYIFGTIHVTNEKAFGFNDRVYWAIDKCENALFELNMEEDEFSRDLLVRKLQNSVLGDEDIQNRIMTYLSQELLPEMMAKYKEDELTDKLLKKIITLSVSTRELMRGSGQGRTDFLDAHLQNYAFSKNKNVVGLETMMEQMEALFGGISFDNFSQIGSKLMEMIELPDKEFEKMFSQNIHLMEYYATFKLDDVCDFMESEMKNSKGVTKKFYERLLIDRNDVHFQKALPYFQEKSTFMAVGAGHLCGKNGVLNQFKKAGYRIRPVDISSEFRLFTEMQTITLKKYYDTTQIIQFKIPKNAKVVDNFMYPTPVNDILADDIAYDIVHPLGKAQFTIISPIYVELTEVEDEDLGYGGPLIPAPDGYMYGFEIEDDDEDEDVISNGGYLDKDVYRHNRINIEDEETDEIYELFPDDAVEEEYYEIDLDSSMPQKDEDKVNLSPEQTAYLKNVGTQLQLKMMSDPELISLMAIGQNGNNPMREAINLEHINGYYIEAELIKTGGTCTLEGVININNFPYHFDLTGDCSLIMSGELDVLFTEFEG